MIPIEETEKLEDYNSELIYYCKNCLSLRIMGIEDCEYCDVCSSTDVGQCTIQEWQEMYKARFGHYYLEEYKVRIYPDFFS